MKLLIFLMIVGFASTSCNKQPEPIAYGHDACHFCKMTIVDQTHSAQIVTDKGKQFKYDAIECLINDIQKNQTPETLSTILVANYSNAGEMIEAQNAHFIISPEISSPMGANLSAVDSQEKAKNLHREHTGSLFTWEALQAHFKEKKSGKNNY
ncbi:MAG: nitrous oxide reductase accessory protein NosL [Flavobacteriaceae bacterium]